MPRQLGAFDADRKPPDAGQRGEQWSGSLSLPDDERRLERGDVCRMTAEPLGELIYQRRWRARGPRIVAIGGGSALDAGKTIAFMGKLSFRPRRTWRWFVPRRLRFLALGAVSSKTSCFESR